MTALTLFPQRRATTFPQTDPELCVTFFTCGPPHHTRHLAHAYPAAVEYLERQRVAHLTGAARPLRYELLWLDNGGDDAHRRAILDRAAQIEHLVRNPTNQGLFAAANDAWFRGRGCSAPYVLNLEDDRIVPTRLLSPESWHIAASMAILQADVKVVGVRLKHEPSDAPIAAAMAAEAGGTPRWLSASGVHYQRHCLALSSGLVWGSFSMAALVFDRERLRRRGGLFEESGPYDYLEGRYALRLGLSGMCTSRPHLSETCKGVPCHSVFEESRPPRPRDLSNAEVLLEGTPLHLSNRSRQRDCAGKPIDSRLIAMAHRRRALVGAATNEAEARQLYSAILRAAGGSPVRALESFGCLGVGP